MKKTIKKIVITCANSLCILSIIMGLLGMFSPTLNVYATDTVASPIIPEIANFSANKGEMSLISETNSNIQENVQKDIEKDIQKDIQENIQENIQEDPLEMQYVGEFLSTAYCCEKYKHICGEGHGITKSGKPVTPELTVAADWDILPNGTWIYIEAVGVRQVQDIGGAIKEKHIDVAVDTHANALKWSGYGTHKVYILPNYTQEMFDAGELPPTIENN